jgi:hypothetical protein
VVGKRKTWALKPKYWYVTESSLTIDISIPKEKTTLMLKPEYLEKYIIYFER